MDKNVEIGILYEYYGGLLTETQSESIEKYYLEDLSITEIADMMGVSKQSISENLKRSERTLLNFEENLGLYKKMISLSELIDILDKNLIEDLDDDKYSKYLKLIYEIKSKLV